MEQDQQYPYYMMPGATTLGMIFSDGVILASEKRITYGYFVTSKAGKKVFKIADHIGAACAGLVSDMQILIREVEAHSNLYKLDVNRKISVRSAGKIMSNLLFNRRLFPLITQTIIGGVDAEGPSIFVLDVLGSLIPDKYAAVGTGAEIAIGVLEENYRENMNLQEAKEMVMRTIKSAISRDSMSGNGVDLLIITEKGMIEESVKL
ncbi:MAG: archaeal proteasome endopeptidase complex subunit beta [Candidatus Bathyarchaeota archaeon]|nr:archaeal proteasome endopeptidase complex subunit beta [Candidatus Bathyarchaeota archaeon]